MFLDVGDAQLSYEIYGQGEAILLLHGNGEDSSYFKHQIAFFVQAGFQVLSMDMRSHGHSSNGKKPLDFHVFAKDVVDLIQYLSLRYVHLLGFSDGANTAMQVAIRYPEYVKSLVLNGGNISTKGIKRSIQLPIQLGYYTLVAMCKMQPKLKVKRDVMGLMVNHPHVSLSQLAKIKQPTLVIVGEHDMVQEAHTKLIYNTLPNASLCILKNGNHFIANKMSKQFNHEVLTFLEEVF